ncbi:hypothetical protein A6S26_05475 [Nostoc sp. ATCC 43529]|nr:hypothetical protein A6S26_05475 [Nostoc sp. ATCC 43529]
MSYKNARNKAAGAKQPETHSEETGQEAGFQLDDQFEEFDTAIANQIVDLRGAKIMQKVLVRISAGDIGTIAPQMLKAFEQGAKTSLGEEVKLLEEWHSRPLRTLPPADK